MVNSQKRRRVQKQTLIVKIMVKSSESFLFQLIEIVDYRGVVIIPAFRTAYTY